MLRLFRPLGGREFRLLWSAATISALGNALQAVALAWLVLQVTGSPVALSASLLAIAVPGSLSTLAGGVVADRVDPRRVMAGSDAVRAAVVGAICVLTWTGHLSLGVLYGLLVIFGVAGGFFAPTSMAIIPRLVDRDELSSANALTQASPQLGSIIGAPAAGVLVATTGTSTALALNAASFICSALLVLRIGPLKLARGHSRPTAMLASAREGVGFIRAQRWLLVLLGVDAVLGLAAIGPMSVGLPVLARTAGYGASGLGLLLMGFGVGSLAGMIYVGARRPAKRPGRQFCLLSLAQAPLMIAVATTSIEAAVSALCLLGFLSGTSVVVYLATIQASIPPKFMGRVMSVVGLFSFGLVPLSQALCGLAANAIGAEAMFIAAAILMVTASGLGLLNHELRTRRSTEADALT